jgi:hypothetical protein
MAHRVNSRQRSTSVAFGAKQTLTRLLLSTGMHSRDHIGGFDHAGCGDFKLDLGRNLIIGQALS